jgi:hypothetical protein
VTIRSIKPSFFSSRERQKGITVPSFRGAEAMEKVKVVFSCINKNFLYDCEVPTVILPKTGDFLRMSVPGHRDLHCYIESLEWQYAEIEGEMKISLVARMKILLED